MDDASLVQYSKIGFSLVAEVGEILSAQSAWLVAI